jgi:hypothetical protein
MMFAAIGIILIALAIATLDWLFDFGNQRPKGAHALGYPTPDNQPTYYVMQRQFVRRRLQGKIRIYVPAT